MIRVVGIGEYAVSTSEEDVLITYALSSCVALTAYLPSKKAGGMVHILLPDSNSYSDNISMWKFADTAIPGLIKKVCTELYCDKRQLEIKVYGGAESINKVDHFRIGSKNIEAVNKALISLDLVPIYKDIGGKQSRSLEMYMDTGMVNVRYSPLNI